MCEGTSIVFTRGDACWLTLSVKNQEAEPRFPQPFSLIYYTINSEGGTFNLFFNNNILKSYAIYIPLTLSGLGVFSTPPPPRFLEHNSEMTKAFLLKLCDLSKKYIGDVLKL